MFYLKSTSFFLMWRESARLSLLFLLSPADVANLSILNPALHHVVTGIDFYSVLKRISDTDTRDAAVWCLVFAHAQKRLWKPKSVSGVERFHFSAASAFGHYHVIKLASDWLHLSFSGKCFLSVKYLYFRITMI